MWTAADIEISLADDACDGSLVAARVSTPAGQLTIIGDVETNWDGLD